MKNIEEITKSGHLVETIKKRGVSPIEETFSGFGLMNAREWEKLWKTHIDAGHPAPKVDAKMKLSTVSADIGDDMYEQDVLITTYECPALQLLHDVIISGDWNYRGKWVCEPIDPDPQNQSDCLLGLILALEYFPYSDGLKEPLINDVPADRFVYDSSVYYTDKDGEKQVARIYRATINKGNPEYAPFVYKCDLDDYARREKSRYKIKLKIRRELEKRGLKTCS